MEGPPTCPRCHSDEVVPIVYGMPGLELIEESRAGRVALAGYVVFPEAPEWRCAVCDFEWRGEKLSS
jgi:hypothetical protein